MKSTGRAVVALCIVLFAVTPGAWAAISASLDRQNVALGDTLQLTITATDDENLEDLAIQPLSADFEILQRSRNSKTSYINGEFSSTRELLLDITPRREGKLVVPPLRIGSQVTSALPVMVGPPPTGTSSDQALLFEAELDRSSVYVQGQIILTLRLQQAINLDDRSITDLQLDNAFVRPLEQNSFQRTINGRPWLVHEVRYAIFPEQSGTLQIPALTFSARESSPRRSLFDIRGNGRQIRRSTEPLQIEVVPRPDSYPASEWLPARKLSVQENWSTPPEDLQVGESATRTITLRGEGLQGAQLPPIFYPPTQGLKYYPDQPVISDGETASGLVGTRVDSVAVVPTEAGRWTIPELRIAWWDTQSNEVRYAVLPQRELDVAAGTPLATTQSSATAPSVVLNPEGAAPIPLVADNNSRWWQVIAVANGVGWLLTLIYLLRSRGSRQLATATDSRQGGEASAFKALLKACNGGSAPQARTAVINWAAAVTSRPGISSLAQVATAFDDNALEAALNTLNQSLYGSGPANWSGHDLAEVATRLRSQHRKAGADKDQTLHLYPQGT